MEELLRQLLNRLDQVGKAHEELYDTECRQLVRNAVMDGFVRNLNGFVLGDDFGLYRAEGNLAVKEALAEYIANANARALRGIPWHGRSGLRSSLPQKNRIRFR